MKNALGALTVVGFCVRQANVTAWPMQAIRGVKAQAFGRKVKALAGRFERHTAGDIFERQRLKFWAELCFGIFQDQICGGLCDVAATDVNPHAQGPLTLGGIDLPRQMRTELG